MEAMDASEAKIKMLSEQIIRLNIELKRVTDLCDKYIELCKMVIPSKVYTHKGRRNTTVRFEDGSTITVKRKSGEKDCIETAIAYCIMKQILNTSDIKKLVNNREEH